MPSKHFFQVKIENGTAKNVLKLYSLKNNEFYKNSREESSNEDNTLLIPANLAVADDRLPSRGAI